MTEKQYAPGNIPPLAVEDWGYPGHLTVEQDQRLKDFRLRLQENVLTRDNLGLAQDSELLRFLRAKTFELEETMQIVQKDVAWRKQIAGRNLSLRDFPNTSVYAKNGLIYKAGIDKENCPVLVFRGRYLRKQISEVGCPGLVLIFDVQGSTFTRILSDPIFKALLGEQMVHYLGMFRRVFVVNNSCIFTCFWSIISPFLDPIVKAQIHVLGKNMDKLLDYIPAANLEKEFGGNHDLYPIPDDLVAPIFGNKTAIVGNTPYEFIRWSDDDVSSTSHALPVAELVDKIEDAIESSSITSLLDYSVADVSSILNSLGLPHLCLPFEKAYVDGAMLKVADDETLKELGVASNVDRKRILAWILKVTRPEIQQ